MVKRHEHDGRVYDTDRAYRDSKGETWTFTGERQQMVPESNSDRIDEAPLAWVVDFVGPLKEVR